MNNSPTPDEADQRRDELLRRALATPPISNDEIVKRAKGERNQYGYKAPGR